MSEDRPTRRHLDLEQLRARMAGTGGREYWRSLEELAGTPEFEELMHREFPAGAAEWSDPVSRRRFLTLMGASLALAGLQSCSRPPVEMIVPYVRAPEDIVPGRPLFFATASLFGGYARGVLVESHMGRPTKVEGNPDHPESRGATDAFAQASVLSLWDPERSQTVTRRGRIATWPTFVAELGLAIEERAARQGAGLALLTETVTSPTLAAQIQALLTKFPQAKWHRFEPVARDGARAGARAAFGKDVDTHYRLADADVILALDADFLAAGPGHLRLVRDFSDRRRVRKANRTMNRLYAVEASPGITGATADHVLALGHAEVAAFARAVAAAIGVPGVTADAPRSPREEKWVAAVAKDLGDHRGRSAVIAGEQQPAAVHALAHALNAALGNFGATVVHTEPVESSPVLVADSMAELAADLKAGAVEILVVIGANPVHAAPADLELPQLIEKAALRVHVGLYEDETARLCHWHVPQAHELESWSDARSASGLVTILQPLIAPLRGGKTAHEVLSAMLGQPERTSYDSVREHWRAQRPGDGFDAFWRKALHDGVIAGTEAPRVEVTLAAGLVFADAGLPAGPGASAVDLVFRPDPTVWDGRFAGNGWLQELPKPITKLTWDNAALMAPALAQRHGLANEDVVRIRSGGRSIEAPVWIVPGHADGSITLHLGHGRTRAGRVGTGAGFDVNALRTAESPWSERGAELTKTGRRYTLACTQDHHSMEGREHVRTASLTDLTPSRGPHEAAHGGAHLPAGGDPGHGAGAHGEPAAAPSLFPPWKYEGHAWGLVVDLSVCTGCSVCVVACQAENNVPVVGKEQVALGREMHWLRLDRYYKGDLDAPETFFQPLLCMHCENAPCEVVCPVVATSHSSEGLNEMTYNRCVGTRYCANNCPYKVRRFNFLEYSPLDLPDLQLRSNPDVTIRERGVMEKCTYCVQRISAARIEAKKDGRKIRDGEVRTACQAACPASAIVFGDLNDKTSEVARLAAEPHDYALLGELNTKPRTTYLARVANRNPALEGA